jgi:hypothetical protein
MIAESMRSALLLRVKWKCWLEEMVHELTGQENETPVMLLTNVVDCQA